MAALAGWPSEYIFNVRITGPEAISDRLSQLAAYTDQPQDSGSFNSIVTGTVLPACGGLTLMHWTSTAAFGMLFETGRAAAAERLSW